MTERAILTDIWVSLGLSVQWCPRYAVNGARWVTEGRTRFFYAGHNKWFVEPPQLDDRADYAALPTLATRIMRHELAHWLAASPEQRARINFDMRDNTSDAEKRAVEIESVIAILLMRRHEDLSAVGR